MTVALHHPVVAARADPLEVFNLRCWARAYLWAAGQLGLHEAVDKLQADAERDGLVDAIGQDWVQQLIASAFDKFQTPEVCDGLG
jgi:hypothetical protein